MKLSLRIMLTQIVRTCSCALLLGCGEKPTAAPQESAKPASPVSESPSVDAAKKKFDAAEAAKTKFNAEQAAKFRKHLNEGRKLERKGDHDAAIAAFNSALTVMPKDLRALSELSYALLQKGDNVRALEIASEASRSAGWDKQGGSIFYNLGRAREALGDKKAALEAYQSSYSRRPNDVVLKRIEALGGEVSTRLEVPSCNKPMPLAEICPCMIKVGHLGETEPIADPPPTCGLGKKVEPNLRLVEVTLFGSQIVTYLAAESTAGWSVVALIDNGTSGVGGQSSEFTLKKTEVRELGDRKILRLPHHLTYTDFDLGLNMVYTQDREAVLICVYPTDPALPLDCPYDVTKKVTEGYELVFTGAELDAARKDDPEFPDKLPPDLPKLAGQVYEMAYDPAGTVTISLKSGPKNAESALMVGTKRLWGEPSPDPPSTAP